MIVFVLRHADRDGAADRLSAAGVARAKRLAMMLADSGVNAALCSNTQRTRDTLAPLMLALGNQVTPTEMPLSSDTAPHVTGIVAKVKALSSESVAVVVSHSQTVEDIVSALGGGGTDPIDDDEFDNLFVLFRTAGATQLVHLRY